MPSVATGRTPDPDLQFGPDPAILALRVADSPRERHLLPMVSLPERIDHSLADLQFAGMARTI